MIKVLRKKTVNPLLTGLLLFTTSIILAQTPVTLPASSPYSQNFNTTPGATGTSYPTGWTSYNGTTVDNTMAAGSASSQAGGNYNFGSNIGILGSGSAFLPGSVVLALTNTSGKSNLKISYNIIKIREQGRNNSFNLEISTTSATAGFTAVTGGTYNSGTLAEGNNATYTNIDISALDNNSGTVWIRWYYNDLAGGSGSRDGIALDNVSLTWGSSSVAPTITGNNTATFNYGTGGSYDFNAAGTPAPTVFTATLNPSGALPEGITLDTPNTEIDVAATVPAGTYNIIISTTTSAGTATKNVTITINSVIPTVTTTAFNQVDADTDSAQIRGGVTAGGGATISTRGFVWNTTGTNLTVGQNTTIVNTDPNDTDAEFSEIIEGLSPNTHYFYRAYATNSAGTGYGTTNNFYTHAATPGAPLVSNATFNTLDVSVNANGNPDATQYVIRVIIAGNVWYVNNSGSLQDTETWLADSSLINKTISGLSPGTNYIFDAKARNTLGIETPWSSTTAAQTLAPSTPYFSLLETDLEFGEVCINTSGTGYFTFKPNNIQTNQQIAVYSLDGFTYSLTENGTYATGLFITYTGQESITVYVKFTPVQVKDYPETVNGVPGTININSASTSTLSIPVYGTGINSPASAVTGTASGISTTSASIAGQVIQGCPAITAYGIEYSTTLGFVNGTGTQAAGNNLSNNNFSVVLSGLTGCTQYYYKTYVTDETGIYYGSEQTFTTTAVAAPVANTGTAITQTGFIASWDAVPGATGYYLDISTSPDFETIYLTEDFSGIIAVEPAQDSNIAGTINTYTSTPGWSGQLLYRNETGNLKLGTSTGQGFVTTPTVNLSGNGGIATLSFRAKYHGTDSGKAIRVLHAANGSTFSTQLGSDIIPQEDFTTYTIPLTGGTTASKIRIQAATATANRFHVDDIKIAYTQLLQNYNNLSVSGTTYNVTGLEPNTAYYYRVRAMGGCTSANSNTVAVQTLKYLELVESNTSFGSICTNANATGSFTFNGFAMANATLTVGAVQGFSYSLTEEGIYTPTLSISNYNGGNFTVYVKFSPAAVQPYSGTIVISGEAGTAYELATLDIPVSGTGIYTPAIATAGTATDITMVSVVINGQSIASNCSVTTAYGIEYSVTNNFENGTGTKVQGSSIDENGNYEVTLSALATCTTYYYKAYTTSAEGTVYSTQQQFTTTSISAPVAIAATAITESGFTANWEAVENAAGYRIDVATNASFETNSPGTNVTETFTAAPTASSYGTRTWTGDNGIAWQATDARTDHTITDKAVTLRAGSLTNTSVITGGLSKLSFKYKRVFTGNSVLKVLINGSQYGGDISVTSDQPSEFTIENLNIQGNIELELRNTGGSNSRTIIDDLAITSADNSISYYVAGFENRNIADANTTSINVTGLDEYTTYYYRVRAYSTNCTTLSSNTISVGTKGTVSWKEVNGTAKWVPEFYTDGITSVIIDATVPVAIEADYNTAVNGVFTAESITLNNGKFTIAAGTTLTVENEIVNNLTADKFVVENNGNLLQNSIQVNSTPITVYRNSSPLLRQDYTMWSSPVAGQNLFDFSPVTLANRFYTYNSTTDEYNAIPGLGESSSVTFGPGKGYLIRMPNGGVDADGNPTGTTTDPAEYQLGNATMVYNGKFTGIPNNGTISVALSSEGNGYNMIGNPYPSPINISQFLLANQDVINGTVWVWRKTNSTLTNTAYCTINRTGQYVDNGEVNTGTNPASIIRTGQGFIVQMNTTPSANNVTFTNAIRSNDTSNQFFRNGSANHTANQPESHGIYLNLTNSNGFYSQMYTGYIEGATAGIDNGIDSRYINDKPTVLSTTINGEEFIIHGRQLPFNNQNTEPVQLRVENAGSYTISVSRLEGLFTGSQEVYLKDNLAGITHNIKESAYTFTTEAGTFANRFEIVYVDSALGTDNPLHEENSVIVYKRDGKIIVNAGSIEMASVSVFDISGRLLYSNGKVNATEEIVTNLQAEQQVLVVQVTTHNNKKVSKKILF